MSTNYPPSFRCPLSYHVMEDPVMDRCAHNFERSAIRDWLELGNHFCPISHKEMTMEDLYPNRTLAAQIEIWKSSREESKRRASTVKMQDSFEICENDSNSDSDDEDEITVPTDSKMRAVNAESYEAPNKMMLLPQERRLLHYVHVKEKRERRKKRRRILLRFLAVAVFLNGFLLTGFLLWIRR